ncbi:MAG TPA: hypothetical protein VN255_13275 [Mycobacterium sp.]|nr:hypothetical protein [Mycobacterium sp.]HWT49496.1 hypothetical protein [Mycobacterium sp.]
MNHYLLAVIADAPHNHGPDFGKASPVGLLVVVLLLIATLLLLRSMNRQLRKVPKTFDPEHPEPDQAADEGTDTVGETPQQPPGPANGSEKAPGPRDEPG